MEIQRKIEPTKKLMKCDNAKLPPNLQDLTEGDTLKIKSQEELKDMGVKENDPLYYLSGRQLVVGRGNLNSVEEGGEYFAQFCVNSRLRAIISEAGYKGEEIPDGEFVNVKVEYLQYSIEKTKDEKEELRTVSLIREFTDDDVKEMISKVDIERLRKQFQAAGSVGKKPITVTDEMLFFYLEKWAVNKMPYYLMFGRNLTIQKHIEYDMEENEMSCLVNELVRKYPKYALNITRIPPKFFVSNTMPEIPEFSTYFPEYKKGMKVSKFFSLFKDKEFDEDISITMQERTVKGFLTISIDPYDYMTHAISMHGWGSCHSIFSCHPTASFMFMIDPANLVAYKHNGKDYTYQNGIYSDAGSMKRFDFKKNTFVGNSKSFRQMICVDPNSCSMIFGREYPKRTTSDDLRKQVREMLESTIADYVGIDNEWDNFGADISHYKTDFHEKHFYSDTLKYRSLRESYGDTVKLDYVTPHDSNLENSNIVDGTEVYCIKCGKKLSSNYVLCEDCVQR